MADFYLDSSAAAKRYGHETGSRWVRGIVSPRARNTSYTVRITGAEIVAGLVLRQRTGSLTVAQASQAVTRFRSDFPLRFELIEVSPGLVDEAMTLAEPHGPRGYDAVQLAAALSLDPMRRSTRRAQMTFVSAGGHLNAAAAAEGFAVENPNEHQ